MKNIKLLSIRSASSQKHFTCQHPQIASWTSLLTKNLLASTHNFQTGIFKNVLPHPYNKRLIQERKHDIKAKLLTLSKIEQFVFKQKRSSLRRLVKNLTAIPRSYIVNIQRREYRRNRQQLLPVAQQEQSGVGQAFKKILVEHLKWRLAQAMLILSKSLQYVKEW